MSRLAEVQPRLNMDAIDTAFLKEKEPTPSFIEVPYNDTDDPWCVDGRKVTGKKKGPQMLGGTLQPVLLSAISEDAELNEGFVTSKTDLLKKKGKKIGVHRGSHKNPEVKISDCGAVDQTPRIIATAKEQQEEITRRLGDVYETYREAIDVAIAPLGKTFEQIAEEAYAKINAYDENRIMLKGEDMIAHCEADGASVIEVEENHIESVAFVNLKPGVTLDTNVLNERGMQGFNLDLNEVVAQGTILGVDPAFAIGASLILYQATEMVLVESKGKPALPIVVHS